MASSGDFAESRTSSVISSPSLAWDSYDPLLSLFSPSSGTAYSPNGKCLLNDQGTENLLELGNRPLTRAQRRLLFPNESPDRALGHLNLPQ